MAKSIDNFNDLQELGIDCIDDDVSSTFSKAADHLKALLPHVDNTTLALLYGYYKQAIEGSCRTPKPSWYDMKAKHKWEAWNKLGNMPSTEAKLLYIQTIKKLDPNFSPSSSNKEGWVTVSTLLAEDKILDEMEKTIVDYVKENDCNQVSRILTSYDNQKLKDSICKLDSDGLGLIHWASDRGSLEILQLLVSFGANVNYPDSEKQTPLHYACSCGHISCVSLLLENGADINAKDCDGQTPLAVTTDVNVRQLLTNFK